VRAAEARVREQRSSRDGFDSSLSANSMASRASFQGSTTSSAQRGVTEATDSDAATVMARRVGRRSGEAKATVIARRAREEQLRSGKAVRAGVTRHGFDAQRKTSGGGKSTLMASQQMERAAELQNPEVRAELNRRVRECERKCFANGRLGSIPQASACARQQVTREQVEGQWCESRAEAAYQGCDQARRSYRRLRGCANRVSVAHAREQWRLSCEQETLRFAEKSV
jgi:hypothetical protein